MQPERIRRRGLQVEHVKAMAEFGWNQGQEPGRAQAGVKQGRDVPLAGKAPEAFPIRDVFKRPGQDLGAGLVPGRQASSDDFQRV